MIDGPGANQLRRSELPGGAKSFELWRGPSRLTDEPVVAIVTGIGDPSKNPKTGEMAQVYFLLADVSPVDALRARDTRAICGECVHAPHRDSTCFVNAGFSVNNVWLSWRSGAIPVLPRSWWNKVFGDRHLRLGAYGDPAAAPDELSLTLAGASKGHTGYTHAWRERPALRQVCMASVSGDAERLEAEAQGWRAFQVVAMDRDTLRYLEPVSRDVAVCGASIERGKKTTCMACGACGGLASKARASIAVGAHGMKSAKFADVRGLGGGSGRDAPAQPEALALDDAWGFVP